MDGVKVPPVPKLKRIHVAMLPAGGIVTHSFHGDAKPKKFSFQTHDKLLTHLAKTMRSTWLGNKSGTPRMRGASAARRAKELETSGYGKK